MSTSSADIKKSIQSFLQNNNLFQTLYIFKNQNILKKQKTRNSFSPDKQIKQIICVNKKQAYQIHKLSNSIINSANPQTQNQLREHFQKTDPKLLQKTFQKVKRGSKKYRNQMVKKEDSLIQMKFFKKLVQKQNQIYQNLRLQQKIRRQSSYSQLQQSRQYQNEWQDPCQTGYQTNQFNTKQIFQVCKQLKAVRIQDYINQVIKNTPFPEQYYQKIAQYKQRNNINTYDKFYSKLPSHVRFIGQNQKEINRKKAEKGEKNKHLQKNIQNSESEDQKIKQPVYPLQMNNIVYDCYQLKVIYDRDKTGFQQQKDIKIVINEVLAGRYQIISNLGQAQFSNAIEVKDLTDSKRYCLKIIKNDNKEYFDQSIDQIKILKYVKANCDTDQKCLLTLHDYFYHKQHLMLLTQLLKDTLLHAYQMNRQMFMNLRNLQVITRQILKALQKLHELHIAHTDLKPQNIMIKSYTNKTVKVIDLGSSVFFHDQPTYYVQTRCYRAPQVIIGIPYDGKIDIWSLGCIIAEAYLGQILFDAENQASILALMQGLRGPWPSWMLQKGSKVSNYFTKDLFIYNQVLDEERKKTGKSRIYTPKMTNMKSRIKTQNKLFLDFLSKCLRLDPSQRISATQALQHPFITQTIIQ